MLKKTKARRFDETIWGRPALFKQVEGIANKAIPTQFRIPNLWGVEDPIRVPVVDGGRRRHLYISSPALSILFTTKLLGAKILPSAPGPIHLAHHPHSQ